MLTDTEVRHYVRGLRFPTDLECAFQWDYYAKSRGYVQVALIILFCVMARDWARQLISEATDPRHMALMGAVVLLPLVVLGLTATRGFPRYWQACACAVYLIGAGCAYWLQYVINPPGEPQWT